MLDEMRALLPPLLLAACGGASAHAVENTGGAPEPASPTIDGSLRGPFQAKDLVARTQPLEADGQPAVVIHAEAAGPPGRAIRFHEFPHGPASSGCAVTIETAKGFYVGREFLCTADRSDEIVITE